jgi:hypothetical protein
MQVSVQVSVQDSMHAGDRAGGLAGGTAGVPDRKVDVYLMSNFEPKYVINLCPRLKLFWAH